MNPCMRWALGCFLAALAGRPSVGGAPQAPAVYVLNLTGVVNPSSAAYVQRGLLEAVEKKADLVVLMINTPGGMMMSMDEIVTALLDSKVPVVAYVAPKGARASSAGVFIALSADVVAMAPGTSMGAAHPVDMQGKFSSEKIVKAAAATMRTIAQRRHRDVKWAESTVRKSEAVTDQEALSLKATDLIAENLEDLLRQLEGRSIVFEKVTRVLATKGAAVVHVDMTDREQLLQMLADPNVAYVLFTLGMLGLIYEFSAPGFGFAGIVGAICMILGLYAFNAITVSVAGLMLIFAATIMFVMEIKIPSHGALTVGGIVAFAMGSLLLFSREVPAFRLSLQLVGLMTTLFAGFFTLVVTKGILAQKAAVVTGREILAGQTGEARSDITEHGGFVFAAGEEWSAWTVGGTIPSGARVRIVAVEGNRVKVERM